MDITSHGILMTVDYQGRNTGEAFVLFASREHAERALEKHRESLGHRWGKKERKEGRWGNVNRTQRRS